MIRFMKFPHILQKDNFILKLNYIYKNLSKVYKSY